MEEVSWQDLTPQQRCVLFSAAEQSMLIGVLANWKPKSGWMERRKYIPELATAARTLLAAGLISLLEEPLGVGESSILLTQDALKAIMDPSVWWQDELEAEDAAGDAEGEESANGEHFYSLIITDQGAKVMCSRGEEDIYAYLDE